MNTIEFVKATELSMFSRVWINHRKCVIYSVSVNGDKVSIDFFDELANRNRQWECESSKEFQVAA